MKVYCVGYSVHESPNYELQQPNFLLDYLLKLCDLSLLSSSGFINLHHINRKRPITWNIYPCISASCRMLSLIRYLFEPRVRHSPFFSWAYTLTAHRMSAIIANKCKSHNTGIIIAICTDMSLTKIRNWLCVGSAYRLLTAVSCIIYV